MVPHKKVYFIDIFAKDMTNPAPREIAPRITDAPANRESCQPREHKEETKLGSSVNSFQASEQAANKSSSSLKHLLDRCFLLRCFQICSQGLRSGEAGGIGSRVRLSKQHNFFVVCQPALSNTMTACFPLGTFDSILFIHQTKDIFTRYTPTCTSFLKI